MRYVVAGSKPQFDYYFGDDPEAVYVRDATWLRWHRLREGDELFHVGDYWSRPDWVELGQALEVFKASADKATAESASDDQKGDG